MRQGRPPLHPGTGCNRPDRARWRLDEENKTEEACMSEKIAVIGMGQMGSGMAGRLRESNLDVVGYDVNAEQRARLTQDGFRMASSIAEALEGRTMVLTSLPDPKAV